MLFGGFGKGPAASEYQGDTWTWDGAAWTERSVVTLPGERDQASLVFFRGSAVLVGGEGGDAANNRTTLDDEWSWDGQNWQAVLAGGSRPDQNAAATSMRCGDLLVITGGYDSHGGNRFDTFTFDGSTWAHYPSPRQNHDPNPTGTQGGPLSMRAATLHDECFLLDNDGELFTWGGNAWRTVDQGSVKPPVRSSAGFATAGNVIVLFGGFFQTSGPNGTFDSHYLDDTWTWDGTRWAQSSASGPAPRTDHGMASFGDTAVLFGGRSSAPDPLGDTWVWTDGSWREARVPGPPARTLVAMAGR